MEQVQGRFLIMAMPVKQLEIVQAVHAPIGARPDMVLFQQIFASEIQLAECTLPVLPLEQKCYAQRHFGMLSIPRCPVQPVAIKWTPAPANLGMTTDRGLAGLVEVERTRCKAPSPMLDAPILSRTPSLPFLGVTTTCPGPQFLEQPAIDRVQCLLAAHGGVVIGPAFDFGVQLGNQRCLRCLLVVVDDGGE